MFKNLDQWLGSYLQQQIQRAFETPIKFRGPRHIIFCFVDHFEPDWNHADSNLQAQRVQRWMDDYPKIARDHKDADGCYPKHTFFYPAEVYVSDHLDQLADLSREGFGEVEIHLHHDQDDENSLRNKLKQAVINFSRHGLLGRDKKTGDLRFGFIHGNWALNNSRQDGRWCGVNNETNILKEMGCYADFTLPSAPDETQTKKINSLYYVQSKANISKSHNEGFDVAVGKTRPKDLMIIQGPLALNWRRRAKGVFPRIENGDVTGDNPPSSDRIDLWIQQRIAVQEKPHWVFVKVHTHGAPEKNAVPLLEKSLDAMFSYLEGKYNDGKDNILHYVTAREMYNMIKAAEAGEVGSPGDYRDYRISLQKENEYG